MRVFAIALGIDERWFDDKIARSISHIRFNKYMAQKEAPLPGQLRAGAHTDYGTLTILYGEDRPGGLQAFSPDGEWIDVRPPPGAFVVNIGDMMARWTNDRWVSTLHRVVNPPRSEDRAERLSIAFFHQPGHDIEIRCIDTCHGPGNPSQVPAGDLRRLPLRKGAQQPDRGGGGVTGIRRSRHQIYLRPDPSLPGAPVDRPREGHVDAPQPGRYRHDAVLVAQAPGAVPKHDVAE